MRISPAEYQGRFAALRAAVRRAGLDQLIVSSFDSIYYLTGAGFEPLERPFFLLVRPEGTPILLVPRLDAEHMRKAHSTIAGEIHTYWDYPSPAGRGWPELLRNALGEGGQIGVEPTVRREIVDELRGFSLQTVSLVEKLRVTKSRSEIEMIRRAARFADFGIRRLWAASYYDSTVAEGFAETRTVTSKIIRELDVFEPLTTRVIMATWPAPNSAMPHSIPDLNDRLRGGPHVALVLTRVNGYAAESERTYFTAPPTTEDRHMFAAMMEARRIAFELIRPNVPCCELDGKVNDFLRQEGYGREDNRLHRTGHGIGLGNHEAPWLAEGSDGRLAENMVVSIEPGIYVRGVGGMRHSDTVLVTNQGCERLTQLPTDLDQLIIRGRKPLRRLVGCYVGRALGLSRKVSFGSPAACTPVLNQESRNESPGIVQ